MLDQDPEGKYEALSKYARDLTAAARDGKLDPVIGRDDEVRGRRPSFPFSPFWAGGRQPGLAWCLGGGSQGSWGGPVIGRDDEVRGQWPFRLGGPQVLGGGDQR